MHKNPQLDLVGWWTLGAPSGPEPRHLPIQEQIQAEYNLESAVLLLFHPDMVQESSGAAGKLPLTLYETVWAAEGNMDVDSGERNNALKYRPVRYTVETGEAEMISVDFVARGGGNATAVDTSFANVHNADKKTTGKGRAKETDTHGVAANEPSYLTAEEDERIVSPHPLVNAANNSQ